MRKVTKMEDNPTEAMKVYLQLQEEEKRIKERKKELNGVLKHFLITKNEKKLHMEGFGFIEMSSRKTVTVDKDKFLTWCSMNNVDSQPFLKVSTSSSCYVTSEKSATAQASVRFKS